MKTRARPKILVLALIAAAIACFALSAVQTGSGSPAKALAAPQALSCSAGGPYSSVAGRSITFTGSASGAPQDTTLTYSWDFGDGSGTTGRTVSHVYQSGGNFFVTLTVTAGNGDSATCTTNAQIQASTLSCNAGGPYTGTVGQPIGFNAQVSGGNATFVFTWDFGDGATATGTSVSHAYTSAGNFQVSLTASSGSTGQTINCSGTTATVTATQITVNTNGPYQGTVGQAITMTASVSGATAPFTFTWNFGDGTSGAGQTVQHAYNSVGTFNISVTANSGSIGQSATGMTTATISATVTISAGGPYTGQTGKAVSFTATASNAPANEIFNWNFGDGGTASGVTVTHIYTAPGTYTVSLTGTDPNTGTIVSANQTTATISNASSITGVTISGPNQATAGTSVSFSATATGTLPGDVAFNWNFGDGTTGSGQTVQHSFSNPGTYTVIVTASSASTGASNSGQATITVTPNGPSVTYGVGWNLVGGPSGTVFPQANGVLYTFQAGDTAYRSQPNTTGITGGLGYWAYFSSPVTVTLGSTSAATASVPAPAGQYVMVGNPSTTQTLTVRGADSVVTWSPSANAYVQATTLAPGQGAWAIILAGGTVTVGP